MRRYSQAVKNVPERERRHGQGHPDGFLVSRNSQRWTRARVPSAASHWRRRKRHLARHGDGWRSPPGLHRSSAGGRQPPPHAMGRRPPGAPPPGPSVPTRTVRFLAPAAGNSAHRVRGRQDRVIPVLIPTKPIFLSHPGRSTEDRRGRRLTREVLGDQDTGTGRQCPVTLLTLQVGNQSDPWGAGNRATSATDEGRPG
jgi:hypothetical protein